MSDGAEPLTHQTKVRSTRQERREARQARIAAREARIASRGREAAHFSKSRPADDVSERALFASNRDPLKVVTRDGQPANLSGLWAGASGFLVCGGPSVNRIPGLHDRLRERGIVSLAVNNSAAYLPVRAMTFSDPPEKFHQAIFFDPAMMKFVPLPKLGRGKVRVKLPDGSFKFTGLNVRDCPNVWGYERDCEFVAKDYLNRSAATWGNNNQGVKKTGGPKLLFTMLLGLRLMHYLGCRRVFLLGADFRMTPEAGYSFQQGRTPGAALSNNNSYRVANEFFTQLRPVLEEAGLIVENVNPESHLEAFDFRPVDEAWRLARGYVPEGPFDLDGWYTFKNEGRAED